MYSCERCFLGDYQRMNLFGPFADNLICGKSYLRMSFLPLEITMPECVVEALMPCRL